MAISPARQAASALARTSASLSWWSLRRSECPTITAQAPASASISAAISPVWAPEAAAWQSWPPIPTGPPRAISANRATSVAGGQTISSALPASAAAPATIFSSSATEAASPFIFQLPATSGRTAPSAMV